jgi:hypothetical protein
MCKITETKIRFANEVATSIYCLSPAREKREKMAKERKSADSNTLDAYALLLLLFFSASSLPEKKQTASRVICMIKKLLQKRVRRK